MITELKKLLLFTCISKGHTTLTSSIKTTLSTPSHLTSASIYAVTLAFLLPTEYYCALRFLLTRVHQRFDLSFVAAKQTNKNRVDERLGMDFELLCLLCSFHDMLDI